MMTRRKAMLSALAVPMAAAAGGVAMAQVPLERGPTTGGDRRTVRPNFLQIYGRRDGLDLIVEVTGENGTGGYLTRLERVRENGRPSPTRFRLINRVTSRIVTQVITPFHATLRVRNYFRDPNLILYAGGFLVITLEVGTGVEGAYLAVGQR